MSWIERPPIPIEDGMGYLPQHVPHVPECPLLTSAPATHAEVMAGVFAEPLKAYKLGKNKHSYNMMHVQIHDANDRSRWLEPLHAVKLEHEENGATFSVDYMYGIRVKLVFHLVYSPAEPFKYQDQDLYQWRMVCRNHCQVQCQGPILKPILRLGRTGRHSNLPHDKQLQMNPNQSKDSRYVYLSIDEASSHIGSLRNTFFRIIVGAYDCDDGRLVGTSCSAPITCVSNNDVPKKAPYIPIDIPVASAWPKWHYCPTQGVIAALLNPAAPFPFAPALAAAAGSAEEGSPAAPELRVSVPKVQASPGRSASPRSATSMAYLGQQGLPAQAGPCPQLQPLQQAPAPKEWEDDSADCLHHAGEPTTQPQAEPSAEPGNNGKGISIAEAAALADAIALQAFDLQEQAPEKPEPIQPFRPNPESVTSNRPKKMRLLKSLL